MIGQNKKIIASILLVLISFIGVAQTPVDGTPPPPMPPPPPGLSIESPLLVILVLVGLFLGIRRKLKYSNN